MPSGEPKTLLACRRFPPALKPESLIIDHDEDGDPISVLFSLPIVVDDFWCGEFLAKAGGAA